MMMMMMFFPTDTLVFHRSSDLPCFTEIDSADDCADDVDLPLSEVINNKSGKSK